MRIFLGSSSEGRGADIFLRVCQWIESAGHEVIRWDAPGVFPPGTYTLEVLTSLSVDAAVLVFSPDDSVWYRNELSQSPRDNVLLEYGLFAGLVGRRRVAIVTSHEVRRPTDLQGLTVLFADEGKMSRAEAEFNSWLKSMPDVNRSKWHPPEESPGSPFQASGKRSLFESGTKMIQSAKQRIALVARTPVLLMGPRPYGQPHPYAYERTQFEAYMTLAENASHGGSPSLICLANRQAVSDDLAKSAPNTIDSLVSNHSRLQELASTPATAFSFVWHEHQASMSYLVADDDFLIWLKEESGESVWIVAANESIASSLYFQAEQLAASGTAAGAIKELPAFLTTNERGLNGDE